MLFLHIVISSRLSPLVNILLVILNYLFDCLDGVISRKFGGTSYGEFMDISVDRIITLGYFSFHTFNHTISIFFFLLILLRNIFVDYLSYFELIESGKKERHKLNKDWSYWVYSSRISKLINGGLQMMISAWGFLTNVPIVIQLIFIINSYLRALPSVKKLITKL